MVVDEGRKRKGGGKVTGLCVRGVCMPESVSCC